MGRKFVCGIVIVAVAALLTSCGASSSVSGTITPAPTITGVTVSPATATVAAGKTATFTASVTGTGNYSSSVTWTASAGTITSSGVLTAPASAGTVTVTATSTEDATMKGTATATVVMPLSSVTVSPDSPTVNAGGTDNLSATVAGGTGNATVAWTMSPSVGNISPASGLTTTYTAPASLTASTTVTVTATATDVTGSITGTATITVERVITIVYPHPIPNNEYYSDFGVVLAMEIDCTGCQTGDNLIVTDSSSATTNQPISYNGKPWVGGYNSTGLAYIPGLYKTVVKGADGAVSNTLWLTFTGSENIAAEDPSSGEIYYAYSGNGDQGSFSVLKFKQDGTADGSFQDGGFGIAVDDTTHDIITTGLNIGVEDLNGNPLVGTNPSSAYFLAASASEGLGCATQPTIDSVSCLNPLPATVNDNPQPFQLPGIPQGSQPAAIKVLDGSHVVVYGRGDQTLRWYTVSGTTATAAGTLKPSEFTATDAGYWQQYPATGGWDLVEVGSTLGVMGQVVNGDGTVSEKLALVNNTNQTLIQYVDLPTGTIHITADSTNNAIVAEYLDFTVSPPITRFERVYVDTGNTTLLTSTSNLVPGAGFLVTEDGSHIVVFVGGQADFEPNQ
jgi:hypothetical protein